MSDRKENINFNLYEDIKKRTNGEIYLGVVGPVRTGKSTFVKRFMDLLTRNNAQSTNCHRVVLEVRL